MRVATTVLLTLSLSIGTGGCAFITRASHDTVPETADGSSFGPSLSDDGRFVAFQSRASGIVPGGPCGVIERDLAAGTDTCVSVALDGTNSSGDAPSISDDGRYVAFRSQATNLVPNGGDGGQPQLYVRDLERHTTVRLTTSTTGGPANDSAASPPVISGDGRYVAFSIVAANLGTNDGLDAHVFVYDLSTGTRTVVSVPAPGGDATVGTYSQLVSISDDGRYVAFASRRALVPGSTGPQSIFVRDTLDQTTTWVSVAMNGAAPNRDVIYPTISGNGRYVGFTSTSTNIAPGANTNGWEQSFVRDLQTNATTEILAPKGEQPNGYTRDLRFSDDGRYVAFDTNADNFVPGDPCCVAQLFVLDRTLGTTTRVSTDRFGRQRAEIESFITQDQDIESPFVRDDISGDGFYVAFATVTKNLVPGDTDNWRDIYVRSIITPTVDSVSPTSVARGTTTTLTLTGSGFASNATAFPAAFGPYGLKVNAVTVVSETELRVDITVDPNAATGTRTVVAWNPGRGPGPLAGGFGYCFGCLDVT